MGTYRVERLENGSVSDCNAEFFDFSDVVGFVIGTCEANQLYSYRWVRHGSKIEHGPWMSADATGVYVAPTENELITYAQCGTTRLQQLVDLFGDMVQDKSGDPATRIQRIDALADIIKNQLQELQTIATPTNK